MTSTTEESLRDRVVAVTGASRGIGLAIVELLCASGARVIGGAREKQTREVENATFVELDVSREASVDAFAERAIAAGVDTLVNNAGVGSFGPFESVSIADYRRVMDTNVLGMLLASQRLIPHFRQRHARGLGSQVINITSDVSDRTFADGGLYTASKHAQRALGRALAFEGAAYGLRVTEIRPGLTDTHFNDATPGTPDRAGHLHPRDVAEAVRYAMSAAAHVRVDEVLVHPVSQPVVF